MNKDQKSFDRKASPEITGQGAVELDESELATVAGAGEHIKKAVLFGAALSDLSFTAKVNKSSPDLL